MLVKKDNRISIHTPNSFLNQHLHRYNLDVETLRNVNFSTTEMSRFLKHKHFRA